MSRTHLGDGGSVEVGRGPLSSRFLRLWRTATSNSHRLTLRRCENYAIVLTMRPNPRCSGNKILMLKESVRPISDLAA